MGTSTRLGAVALFDGVLEPKYSRFSGWLKTHRPMTVAFRLDAEQVWENVIEGNAARKQVGGIVVHGEVCHVGPILWNAVQGCLFVRAASPEQRVFLETHELGPRRIAEVIAAFRRPASSSLTKRTG